jgi:hypothetical protein
MLIVMTSPDALLCGGVPNPEIAKVLIMAKANKYPVGVISNHPEPKWFAETFGGTGVQFLQVGGRQTGDIVSNNAKRFSMEPFNVLVLASKREDLAMGKNGGAVLIEAGWSITPEVSQLGIHVANANQFHEVITLMGAWSGQWWYSGDAPRYRVRALADLSGYGKSMTQQVFAGKLKSTVKNGGSRLNALLAITARSLLMDGVGSKKDLLWGVYPSSNSRNDDNEILSDFTHRLRTTVSRVKFCKRGEPLFIRHTPSRKRSDGGVSDRTDPTEQITTIHLNRYYQDKGRLIDKHVIVIDDCSTYGVSFAVAAALLRKAGAASVTGIALGKFGDQLGYYEIDINSDPYQAVGSGGFTGESSRTSFPGASSLSIQQSLQMLIP